MPQQKKVKSDDKKWRQSLQPTPLFKGLIRLLTKRVARNLKELQEDKK